VIGQTSGASGPTVAWGQVWWIESPAFGRRPGVVLTRPAAVHVLPRLLVAPATTTRRDLPSEVALDRDDGMPVPCVLSLDTPELVPRALLVEHLTTLSPVRMAEICRALREAVNCAGLGW
jgi:mRNA interferase MazF